MIETCSAVVIKVSQLTVAVAGTSFGVDINPAADRLRIVSDAGQNLRHNVNAGGVTLLDDPLDYPPATPVNAVGSDATGVPDPAYTNNDLDALTGTTLYALDSNLDQIDIYSPPNDGTLAATGKLGVDATLAYKAWHRCKPHWASAALTASVCQQAKLHHVAILRRATRS